MATQFDIIRNQAEAAARNAAARIRGNVRRETSLVNQASRWAGRAMTEGEAALRSRSGRRRGRTPPPGRTTAEPAGPVRPASDGYVRRSPVQPLHVMEGYRKRQVLRVVTVIAVVAAIGVGICLLNRLGIFGR